MGGGGAAPERDRVAGVVERQRRGRRVMRSHHLPTMNPASDVVLRYQRPLIWAGAGLAVLAWLKLRHESSLAQTAEIIGGADNPAELGHVMDVS